VFTVFFSVVIAAALALPWAPTAGEPVRVRFSESMSHGFLVLRNYQGDVLAHGEYVSTYPTTCTTG
jgi:hypothetical protein